jgi:hypothetical protein
VCVYGCVFVCMCACKEWTKIYPAFALQSLRSIVLPLLDYPSVNNTLLMKRRTFFGGGGGGGKKFLKFLK